MKEIQATAVNNNNFRTNLSSPDQLYSASQKHERNPGYSRDKHQMAHMPLQIITKQKTKAVIPSRRLKAVKNMEDTAERQCPAVKKRCREDDLHDLLRTRPQKHVVTL
jgi:hypothetical protein